MHGSRWFSIALLATAAAAAMPAPAQPRDGGWIVRAAPGLVVPTGEAVSRGEGFAEFTDPRFPPQGTMDLSKQDLISAQSDLGLGLEVEHVLTDVVGVTLGLGYTKLVGEATFSGEAIFTPYVGEPMTLAPEHSRSGPITGGATGRTHLLTFTVGASFHVVRNDEIDVYLGPVIGLAASEPRFAHGTMLVTTGLVSTTPLAGTQGDTRVDLAFGGVLGVDRPLGGKGWLLTLAARYLWTDSLNPSMVQLGLGYRF